MKDCLAGVGLFFVILVGIIVLCALWYLIKELIDIAKRAYRIKHRFDKPPTAKCYCRDCAKHNNETKQCSKFSGWYTADNWFCWDADPGAKGD